MSIALFSILSLAATASLCGWGWYQFRSTSERRTTLAWTLGGLTVGMLTIGVIWALSLTAQRLRSPDVPASVALDVPWPAKVRTETPSEKQVSQRVMTSLKQAQDAMRKNELDQALAHVEAAELVRERTPRHDYLIAQFRAYLLANLEQYPQALEAVRAQLSYPDLKDTERTGLLRPAAQLAYRTKQYSEAIDYAREYLATEPRDESMTILLIQALYLEQRHDELLPLLRSHLDAQRLAGRDVDIRLLQMRMAVERPSTSDERRALAEALARDFPQHRDALLRSLP